MRVKNWMLGGILAIVAILGPMVAYAGVSVIYPVSTQTAAVDTTPLITFQAGDDHALAQTLGFAGAFTQADNAASFTLTLNSLSGGSVTIDNYAEGVADASVGVWSLEVVGALTGTLTNPTELRIRVWNSGGAAPTADNSASVCALLDLEAIAGTDATGTCADDVNIQVIYTLPTASSGSSTVTLRPVGVTYV